MTPKNKWIVKNHVVRIPGRCGPAGDFSFLPVFQWFFIFPPERNTEMNNTKRRDYHILKGSNSYQYTIELEDATSYSQEGWRIRSYQYQHTPSRMFNTLEEAEKALCLCLIKDVEERLKYLREETKDTEEDLASLQLEGMKAFLRKRH
jgi:hypothetical protein